MKTLLFRATLFLLVIAAGCNFPAASPAAPTPAAPPSPTRLPPMETPAPAPSDTPPAPTPIPPPDELTPAGPSPTWTAGSPATVALMPDATGWAAQVVLAEGRCCVGGVVGNPVEIPLAFQADGPAGPATEMRYRTSGLCLAEDNLAQDAWQPYQAQIVLQTRIQAINWIGFYVSAQFRDVRGNLSPVVCDDISMEGMPAPPTASP